MPGGPGERIEPPPWGEGLTAETRWGSSTDSKGGPWARQLGSPGRRGEKPGGRGGSRGRGAFFVQTLGTLRRSGSAAVYGSSGGGMGGALCSLFAARPQGTSSLAGGLASSLPPHRARKPRPRKGKCALQECPAGSLRTECRSLRHPLCRPPGRRPRRGSWGGAGAQEARGHDTACWWPVWCRPPPSHMV